MIKPTNHNSHENLLSDELLAESLWLNRNAPTFGHIAPIGYAERAKAFNEECRKLGADLMQVVTE